MHPTLHIQNLFDALNLRGWGVNGYLKLKCLPRQNRVVGLASQGDIVVVSADCPPAFVRYMLRTTMVSDVVALRYQVDPDPRKYLDSQAVFESLVNDPKWEVARQRSPILSPYVKSAAVYKAARASGIPVSQSEWQAAVLLTGEMNDKAKLYQECEPAQIPVPQYWVTRRDSLVDCVADLLETDQRPLYIRQTRSAATIGNITVRRERSRYLVPEFKGCALSYDEFVRLIQDYTRTSFEDDFIIAELLDLYASPGTLYFADDNGVTVVCHTAQILNKNRTFLGFTFPIEDDKIKKHFQSVEQWVRRLIEPWRQKGFRGYGNIDWMITKEGSAFLAERNARQTAVIPSLTIADACSGSARRTFPIGAPAFSIITRDIVPLERAHTFEEVYAALNYKGLLWEQNKDGEGVIITAPPLPRFGNNSAGVMAIGHNLERACEIYIESLGTLGAQESELLFGSKT